MCMSRASQAAADRTATTELAFSAFFCECGSLLVPGQDCWECQACGNVEPEIRGDLTIVDTQET